MLILNAYPIAYSKYNSLLLFYSLAPLSLTPSSSLTLTPLAVEGKKLRVDFGDRVGVQISPLFVGCVTRENYLIVWTSDAPFFSFFLFFRPTWKFSG